MAAESTPQFPEGVHVVSVTPFLKGDRAIDFSSLASYITTTFIPSKAIGLVLLGTTSESPALSFDEKVEMVKGAWELLEHTGKFLTVGVGGSYTWDCVRLALAVRNHCHGLMVTVPAYNKPNPRGQLLHFETVAGWNPEFLEGDKEGSPLFGYAELQKLPMMVYNVPSRTGTNMTPDTLMKLVTGCDNVLAIKEASGDPVQVQEMAQLSQLRPTFRLFSGDDLAILPTTASGGCGVVSVAANLCPDQVTELYELCRVGDYAMARVLNTLLFPLFKSLFVDTNPAPVKTLMAHQGIYPEANFRTPMVPLTEETKDEVVTVYMETLERLKELESLKNQVTDSSRPRSVSF